jgi:hypothetical protein
MDDLDKELLAFVDSGILDLDRINSTAATLNEQVSLQRSSGSYERSWRPFHDSFDDNLGEVTKSIVDSLRTNIAVVSLSNFDTTVKLLKEFGKLDEAKQVIDFYMTNKKAMRTFGMHRATHSSGGRMIRMLLRLLQGELALGSHDIALIDAGKSYDPEIIKNFRLYR